jgi:N-acetylneuraminic acid mutarotase
MSRQPFIADIRRRDKMNQHSCSPYSLPARLRLGVISLSGAVLLVYLLASATQVLAQQPKWNPTSALGTARFQHTATPLEDGKVLVVGGLISCRQGCETTSTAELYDPATGTWSSAGTLPDPLANHATVRLQNGKVLVVGGYSRINVLLSAAHLYNPETGQWSPAGNLGSARQFHTAVLLTNGKVLVAGGLISEDGHFVPTASAELYDPATGEWSDTGAMNLPRFSHTMTSLLNGKALVATGSNANLNQPPFLTPVRSCELYDPETETWSLTGEVSLPRSTPTATLLLDGRVLLAGGTDNNTTDQPTNKAELYDPGTEQWGATGDMTFARDFATETKLPNGRVMLIAGYGNEFALLEKGDIYDPATGTWSPTGKMGRARVGHTATLLNDGKILVAAGYDDLEISEPFTSAELFDSAAIPQITSVSISGKKLFVQGTIFDEGADILLNGQKQKTANDGANPNTILKGKKAGKKITPGLTVRLRVRNLDGTESPDFVYTRPAQ